LIFSTVANTATGLHSLKTAVRVSEFRLMVYVYFKVD